MVTLEELDQQLHHWQKAVEIVVANVYELYEHPVHRALVDSSSNASVTVTGESRAPVEEACEAITHLLLCGNELHGVVERARTQRERLPLLFREEKVQQIDSLLRGPSIQRPTTNVPLTQRGLLSEAVASGSALTLQEMLDTMIPAFEAAKRTILAVDHAWSVLPSRLDDAAATLLRLRETAQSSEASVLQQKIDEVRAKISPDPLGALRSLEEELSPALAQARASVETAAADLQRMSADFDSAHALQRELAATHARATIAAEDCRTKVTVGAAAQPGSPVAAEQIAASGRWLTQIDAMMVQSATRAQARVGVQNWLEEARQILRSDQIVLRANQALLDERQELRGRLDALRAKAAGLGLAEDGPLEEAARAARALLYQRPTPLEEARSLVARYQERLNARIAAGE